LLRVLEDESIHSLIYRTHVINGISDFSNIITIKGGWASFPKILKDTLQFYDPVDDLKFLNLLRDFGLAKITVKMFKEPLAYREDLEKFFGCSKSNKRIKQKSKQIKYCLKCIQEHIRDFGYGIIKLTWGSNDQCFEHSIPLYYISESNRKDAILALEAIYRGEQPKNYAITKYISDYFYDPREYYHSSDIDYIAPCLEQEFKVFIQNKRFEFSEKVSETVGISVNGQYTSESYLKQPYMMQKIYNALKITNEQVFNVFWKKHVESQRVFAGVINKRSIKEKLFKEKSANCQRCSHYSCGANLSIIKPITSPKLLYQCISSIINIENNAFALGIIDRTDWNGVKKLSKQKLNELHELGDYWKTV